MILYFLRHGLAENRMGWHEDDSQRPLTKKGRENLAIEAKVFRQLGLTLDAILTSPLVRARQTAEIVASEFKQKDDLIQDERLSPGFGIAELEQILAEYPEAEALMLVGHEPDFSETIGALIGGGRVVCKKGGLARVDILSTQPALEGELVWLIPPKELLRGIEH